MICHMRQFRTRFAEAELPKRPVRACFSGLLAGQALIAAALAETPGDGFELSVSTHFSQGWDLSGFERARSVGAGIVRDDVYWSRVEAVPGQYDMSSIEPYMTAAEAAGIGVLLIFQGSNPAYDGGTTPYTDAGREAFADYVAAVVEAFRDTIHVIEIGNEYNTDSFVSGPFAEAPGPLFGPLVAAVDAALEARGLDVEILCTGAHSVATGYLRAVFESGALPHCDVISFHPYRDTPAHVDTEIARLREVMAEFGADKPLYASEFGQWFEDPADAPDFMLKMVAMMGGAGVKGATWYALYDEPWWPNMGLYETFEVPKPAAATFRFLQETLLPLGRPVLRGTRGEDRLYEFGDSGAAFVAWGAPAEIVVTGGEARYHDSSGQPIAPVTQLSERPVVILGEGLDIRLERSVPIHDVIHGYGAAPWSYLATAPERDDWPLTMQDWNWNPYLGHASLNPLKVTPSTVVAADFDGVPHHAVERFTAPAAGRYRVRARWYRDKAEEDGADIRIGLNGTVLATGRVNAEPFVWQTDALELAPGDRLDFAVGPGSGPGGDWVRRDISLEGPFP